MKSHKRSNDLLDEPKQKKAKHHEDDDFLSQFLPKSFGKQENNHSISSNFVVDTRKKVVEPKERAPVQPVTIHKDVPVYTYGVDKPPEEEEEDKEVQYEGKIDSTIETETNEYHIPYTHEVFLTGHSKAISTIQLDPSGVRMISGSFDNNVMFWDFHTMDASFKSFRQIEPFLGYVVHTLRYSHRGDCFLAASSSPHIKLFDREGRELAEYEKGYQYISDLSRTNGHTTEVTCLQWHPTENDYFLSSSMDSTIRIWNVEQPKKQMNVIKIRNERGLNKSPVTTFTVDKDYKYIICGSTDGSIQLYDTKSTFSKSKLRISNAHQSGEDISCLQLSEDGNTLISRSKDHTLKVWDIRSFKEPMKVFDNLPNKFRETNCIFDPNDRLIVTGTSRVGDDDVGKLVFIDKYELNVVKTLDVSTESVVNILWHPTINQIICGCSDNKIHVLFDEYLSTKGALDCAKRVPRKKIDFGVRPEIYSLQQSDKSDFTKPDNPESQLRRLMRKEPSIFKKPEPPVEGGAGYGGHLGTSLQSEIMKKLVKKETIEKDEDPREVIFRHARETSQLKDMYKIKQTHNPLDYEGLKEIEEEERRRQEAEEKK